MSWKEEIETRFIKDYYDKDFREAQLEYEDIVENCRISKTTFYDTEFPYENNKIIEKRSLFKSGKFTNFLKRKSEMKWIRPVVAFPSSVRSFWRPGIRIAERYDPWTLLDDPQASDVHQTGVGDCCLIAALSVIAERPGILEKIFPRREISEYGVYEVRLCDSGEWKSFLVDDWFPARGDVLITARTENHQLWVPLIEKTIAKIYGGYDNIEGITRTESLTLLTGFPIHQLLTFDHSEDENWELLISAKIAGDLMVIGTNSKTIPKRNKLELKPNHAYSLLDVQEFDGHRLIRLRDPNGLRIWKGKWGPLWEGWREYDIRKRIELNGSFEKTFMLGEFWMGFDDFLKYFPSVSICRYRPNWYTIQVKTVVGGEIDDRNKAIHITVHEECRACFSAYSQFGKEEERAITLICICRCYESGRIEEVTDVFCFDARTESTADTWLKPGNYVIMAMKFGIKKTEGNIVIHSSKPLDAHLRVPLNPTVMVESVQKYIQKWGNAVKLNIPSASIHKYWFSSEAMMILAENRSSDQYFHVNVYYERYDSEYYSTRPHISARQEDTIPPMSRQIIMVLKRLKWEKIDLKLDMEYSMSLERFGKYGKRKKRSHDPIIHSFDYIHHVLAIDND